jgi:hypothetical protein
LIYIRAGNLENVEADIAYCSTKLSIHYIRPSTDWTTTIWPRGQLFMIGVFIGGRFNKFNAAVSQSRRCGFERD